jgi:hypothetical protein
MARKKRRAKHPLDVIASNWCGWEPGFKLPARWTHEAVIDLCDRACTSYADGEGIFAPLRTGDRKLEARRAALLKEIKRLMEALDVLKKVRSPTPETQRVTGMVVMAIQSIKRERQQLNDFKTFEELPTRPKKIGRGRPPGAEGGPMRAQLIFDLAEALRFVNGNAVRNQIEIARTISELLKRHGIKDAFGKKYASAETINQALRNAEKLKYSKNRIS